VNRLAGKRVTVVEEHRGVTRDRKAVEVEWGGLSFDVVDTGGWLEAGDSLEAKVSKQAEAALATADLCCWCGRDDGNGRRGHARRSVGAA